MLSRYIKTPFNLAMQSGRIFKTSTDSKALREAVKSFFPTLTNNSRKGESGRVAVVGGSFEYTGAPYFAAISSLKTGADLSYVLCARDAAIPIKSYSPELIVHPVLNPGTPWEEYRPLERAHAIIAGPGLGRRQETLDIFARVLNDAVQRNVPTVVDADGTYYIAQKPDILPKSLRVVLTPNDFEFKRLFEAVLKREPTAEGDAKFDEVSELSKKLGVIILRKGSSDIVSDGSNVLVCDFSGSPRRCGGQGDLLSGSLGTFAFWSSKSENPIKLKDSQVNPMLVASYASCLLTRECNRLAFGKFNRSTTTTDMIAEIHTALQTLFD